MPESLNVSSLLDATNNPALGAMEAHAGATLDAPVSSHASASSPVTPEPASREPGAFGKLTFADMALSPLLLEVLAAEGYEKPTPIQAKAIPVALTGRDILGSAQTGTGKTAAFALPILHRLQAQGPDKARRGPAIPRALVLAPTRELAAQIHESLITYGRKMTLRSACVYGGASMFHQVRALRSGVDVLVATPGRLIDLMEQGHADLSGVEIFVLDEADRMLDMGFIQPIKRIAGALTTTKPRQTMLFSATMAPAIRQLASSLLREPQQIAVANPSQTATRIEQKAYYVDSARKLALLLHLLGTDQSENAALRAVVFTRTKFGAERLADQLHRHGVSSDAIHGNKAQNQRKRALDAFRTGRVRVLVATDVAARGLDVDDVTHVFNFDLPMEPEAYVHRIGRTGRAGSAGVAISFVTPSDADELRQIQRLTKATIQVVTQLPPGLVRLPRVPHDADESDDGPQREFQPRAGGYAAPGGSFAGHASSHRPGHAPASPARPHGHGEARGQGRIQNRDEARPRSTSDGRVTRADLGLPPSADRPMARPSRPNSAPRSAGPARSFDRRGPGAGDGRDGAGFGGPGFGGPGRGGPSSRGASGGGSREFGPGRGGPGRGGPGRGGPGRGGPGRGGPGRGGPGRGGPGRSGPGRGGPGRGGR
jgi:ATP-dependent RNA helicase RhlE